MNELFYNLKITPVFLAIDMVFQQEREEHFLLGTLLVAYPAFICSLPSSSQNLLLSTYFSTIKPMCLRRDMTYSSSKGWPFFV